MNIWENVGNQFLLFWKGVGGIGNSGFDRFV
jgi:hypothetical protein